MSPASALTALSPLDGRYASQLLPLSDHFSEFSLIKNRVLVEVEYFLFLSKHKVGAKLTAPQQKALQKIVVDFDVSQAARVKELEVTTKHDVKAVEYYLREQLEKNSIPGSEWLHFALTSEDVNSLAFGLCIRNGVEVVLIPELYKLLQQLTHMVKASRHAVMLSRTHGQPAVPTTFGKELLVFAMRLAHEVQLLQTLKVEAKLSGAVGNFNAQLAAFPKVKWLELSHEFITSLGLVPNHYATQIVPPESYLKISQSLLLINGIILDLDQDIWRYISDGYLGQSITKGQVGSSTMPHKINPIDFENSEGNIGLANALLAHFVQKLPVSRLQRDLSDSTVKRNFGVAFGYSYLAYASCLKGLKKVLPHYDLMAEDLAAHWEIIGEGVQTILRTTGDEAAYEKLKTASQGQHFTQLKWQEVIESLQVDTETKNKLLVLKPDTYIGAVDTIVDNGLQVLTTLLKKGSHEN